MTDTSQRLARVLLKEEIEEFLYQEAELLDERRYEEWLSLLTDDVRYFMPMRRNVKFGELDREFTREGQDISWFDEGKDTLTRRVNQILTGIHWAEEPLSASATWYPTFRSSRPPPRRRTPKKSGSSLGSWYTVTGCKRKPTSWWESERIFCGKSAPSGILRSARSS